MEKIKKLNIITGFILIGFIVAVIYHLINTCVFNLGFPFDRFVGADRWMMIDFRANYTVFNNTEFNPYMQSRQLASYFPFGIFVVYLWTLIPNPLISIIIFLFSGIVFFSGYNFVNINKVIPKGKVFNKFICFISLSFLSYPFLFELYSANQDLLIFIFIALFAIFFVKEKYLLSAILISFPIAMKGYPLLFLALFIARKKYKPVFVSLALTLALSVATLFFAKGSFVDNFIYFVKHMELYKNMIVYTTNFNHGLSLFSTVKLTIMSFTDCLHQYAVSSKNVLGGVYNSFYYEGRELFACSGYADTGKFALTVYKIFSLFSIILTGLFTLYTIFYEKELWKQAAIVFICTLIFAPHTGPYKLINLFVPLWLFIHSENRSKLDLFYLVCFGFVLIPKYFIYIIEKGTDNYMVQTMITDPLVMLLMISVIVIEGFYSRKNVSKRAAIQERIE